MGLETYKEKRDFEQTPEPAGKERKRKGKLHFVVQRHQASTLHYDFRLEMEGVLKSWAVPKGPSMNPADKRLAMEVEDHPVSYGTFEGDIPEGNYGAGHVDIWDSGEYHAAETEDPAKSEKQLLQGLTEGSIKLVLEGEKLRGEFALVKMKGRQKGAWLLIKKDDAEAVHEGYDSEDHLSGGEKSAAAKASKKGEQSKTKGGKRKATGKAAEMPHHITPMMAKLTDGPFDSEDWVFEIKWDGYRAVAEVKDGQVELYSRSGKSFNEKYPPIVESLRQLGQEAVLDGEIVVLDEEGYATFQRLQNYQNTPSEHLYYYAFDLLYLNGEDLRQLPLIERKKRLQELLSEELPAVRYSDHVEAQGIAFFKEAQRKNVEGIMGKLANSPYRTGSRSSEWLKIKTHLRQEAVIGGYTAPKGKRKHIGALVLGVYENGRLTYVGQSGSGFNSKSLVALKAKLEPLEQEATPFTGKVNPNAPVTWVKPELVAEITFAEWTSDGLMRQAIFEGLREDKNPKEVVREEATQSATAKEEAEKPAKKKSKEKPDRKTDKKGKNRTEQEIDGQRVSLSSQDKLYWPDEHITKGDLIDYYQSIAEVLMPYLQDRPQTLLRHPNGITKAGFFQKDMNSTPDWVRTVALKAESTGEEVDYLVCDNKATLAYMNNLGCIQLNPWNSRLANLQQPDFLVLDLDPGENNYDEVIEVALAMKAVLDGAGAPAFCKTSGATGMHIYVPLGAKYPFEEVRNFAHQVAQKVHERLPKLTSLERSPKERRKQIYLDYLQNSIGQTVAAPYSARPKPGATVSAPLLWEEVKLGLRPAAFTIRNMAERIKEKGDLFRGVLGEGIDLAQCRERISK
ncbi:ATP-dependent DNA ligase LigD phosphoesterase module /ATP-dependent DNA ligase LigD polymerase module [Pontibacter ummariensis]|uniref:DNA ligase (ATP) n=1 Tax=Pontibacter ummariensis TaxID=1610492 RepID=A0A239I9Y3_9BACT|nr:DNA ligase D [Pontibacter ummariensis]PRY09963.1 ATP-dependent DNA ligase LigD phosphoesterase module /ATP-dependent DNA ligase LigD polymerase module [Pontibacter ummariensis]SNS90440.1 ATP-dependent DNA ligase LigD phosphoesterase module /ATP-dependent DNA ligase LigD polymerase module [Pontibacter ummariensis]